MKRNRSYLIQSFEQEWTCPITSMPMIDPVLTLDGHSYERNDIMEWLRKQRTSPKTGLNLNSDTVIPNIVLKNNEFKYEFDRIGTENAELNLKLQTFEEKARGILKQKNRVQTENNQLKGKYSELLNNSKKVGEMYILHKKEIQTLRTENLSLKKQNTTLKTDVNSVQALKVQNKTLKTQSEKAKNQNKLLITQNQNLIQQRCQNQNLANNFKAEVQTAKKQNEALRNLLNEMNNKYTGLLGKIEEFNKIKVTYEETVANYNALLVQFNNLQLLVQKTGLSKTTDYTKDNEIQRLKLQCSRYKIENNNIKNQIKVACGQIEQLKLDHQKLKKLKHLHSFCLIRSKQEQSNRPDANNKQSGLALNKPQKMEEQKPSSSANNNPAPQIKPNLFKLSQQVSKKQEYEPSKSWEAPDPSNSLKESLDKIKNSLTNINQNANSMPTKSTDSNKTNSGLNLVLNNSKEQKQEKIHLVPELKPNPIQKVGSSAPLGQNMFHSLIKESVNRKIEKMQEQSRMIKNVLPFKDYLLQNPVLYDQQKAELDHSGYKINMEEFLKYNWSQLKTLNFSDTQIDDKGFQLLVTEAISFNNLNNLWLWSNLIVNVPKFALERFKNIKTVFFSIKGRFPNPLSEESKSYLKEFSTKNPLIQVRYDNQPS